MQLTSLGCAMGIRPTTQASVSIPARFGATNQPALRIPFSTKIAAGLKKGLLLTGLIWGGAYAGCAAYNHVQGDGPVPGFRSIARAIGRPSKKIPRIMTDISPK